MQLSTMQDIGGVRTVLPTVKMYMKLLTNMSHLVDSRIYSKKRKTILSILKLMATGAYI